MKASSEVFSRGLDTLTTLTVCFTATFLLGCFWIELSAFPPGFVYYLVGAAAVACGGLFFVNAAAAMLDGTRRRKHILNIIIILATGLLIFPLSAAVTGSAQHRWFHQVGRRQYESMVDIVRQSQLLTSESTSLDALLGHRHVFGKTNSDGSLTIVFQGKGNWPRAGYVYYSGDPAAVTQQGKLYVVPGVPGLRCSHLTNAWYEY